MISPSLMVTNLNNLGETKIFEYTKTIKETKPCLFGRSVISYDA
jgi:hypothetical protein